MHPYKTLGDNSFWSTAVAQKNMFDIAGLWTPRIRISPKTPISTYGSCFAQHFGRALGSKDMHWLITEPAPEGLSDEHAHQFNYGVFSARTGNIYTSSLLLQWISWATGEKAPPDEVWEKNDRFYDPFRPNIEPNGFANAEELVRSRTAAISAFKESIVQSKIFVFTLGLTESWIHRTKGYEYPMCPGTVAGEFSSEAHEFVNQSYKTIWTNLKSAIRKIRQINPSMQILLTVSPVPLTATMSGNHVLVATMESKSILRAVAGAMQRELPFVDYFPSYEIINSTPYRGSFFEPNQRSVNHAGVAHVMSTFFGSFPSHMLPAESTSGNATRDGKQSKAWKAKKVSKSAQRPGAAKTADVVCEEELLAAFGKQDGAASA